MNRFIPILLKLLHLIRWNIRQFADILFLMSLFQNTYIVALGRFGSTYLEYALAQMPTDLPRVVSLDSGLVFMAFL
jgi:hypothetical protein